MTDDFFIFRNACVVIRQKGIKVINKISNGI